MATTFRYLGLTGLGLIVGCSANPSSGVSGGSGGRLNDAGTTASSGGASAASTGGEPNDIGGSGGRANDAGSSGGRVSAGGREPDVDASAAGRAADGGADHDGAAGCTSDADCKNPVKPLCDGACLCTPGTTRPCYDGAGSTENVGVCHGGTQSCDPSGLSWGACTGEVIPSQQLCLGKDEDCDGKPQPAGCTPCVPGVGSCDGNVGTYCPDGLGKVVENCDPLEGMTCANGQCLGSCSKASLGTSSNVGCDFYPMVTANPVDSSTYHYAIGVSNASGSTVSVTVYKGPTLIASATILAHATQSIDLPWDSTLQGPSDLASPMPGSVRVNSGAYHLRSTQPIAAYQFNALEATLNGAYSYTDEASILLPTTSWTGKYFVSARHSFAGFSGFYAVTARDDGTKVTVVAPPASVVVKAGVTGVATNDTGTVTLNSGDVIEVVSGGGTGQSDPNDVSGTLVTATGPIEVIGGHQCTNVPDTVGTCDHLEESMFPVEALSTSYIVTAPAVPSKSGPGVEVVRIMSTTANTHLTYDPPQAGAPATIPTAGAWVEMQNTSADFRVVADQPILVTQYMVGTTGAGDPAMTLAIATEQYRGSYSFYTPSSYYYPTYVNVTAPAGVAVTLDGTAIAAASFTAIGTSGFSVARVALGATDNHSASASKPFGVTTYGYGSYTAYWYPAGTQVARLHD